MQGAGWVLIVAGIVWIFVKTGAEIWAARKAAGAANATARGALPTPGELAELLAAPYGVGVTMILLGVVLMMVDAGVEVSFEGSTPEPTPTST